MAFNSCNLTNGAIMASSNMMLDKVEFVMVPNTSQALGFVTVLDTGLNGKVKGKKRYWGLLPETPNDQDIIDIALYGGKWENHSMKIAFSHHYES